MQLKKSFESQLAQLLLIASLPPFLLLLWVMFYANISIFLIMLTTLFGSLSIIYCYNKVHRKSAYQFRSLSNLLDAMIHEDYTLRARASTGDIALNELVVAINTLAKRLNKQRIENVESQMLLNTVINHIDVAIIALNANNELVLINPAAQKLLGIDNIELPNNSLKQLEQLGQLVNGQNQVMPLTLGHQNGKFNVHMEEFREAGKPHKLLFITDVSNLLRSEERNAWQSLVRVISHEINNSLAPISSISQTLKRTLSRQEDAEACRSDLLEGLAIVAQRASNLTEFVNSYKQIVRLPQPKKQATSITNLIDKVIPLFHNKNVTVTASEDINLLIDPIQFEQVLINLIKNAVESVENTKEPGEVNVSWQSSNNHLTITVRDDGAGISNTDNLFVPFYTTKKQGSGIGLVLCRQILEVHNGQLSLINRKDRNGCLAIIELPLK